MLRSGLCICSDAYILMSGTVTNAVLAAGGGNNNIQAACKTCAQFTNCISEMNNTQINNAKDFDVVMPIHNLLENSNNYSKTSGSLWQYYREKPALTDASALDNFPGIVLR